jgi:hypothetical protein
MKMSQIRPEYSELFVAVGRFVAKKGLTDVCMLEFEQGVIVTGMVLYETGESYNRVTETHILSFDDLRNLMRQP